MLLLSRKLGEEIVIDGNIRITVSDLASGQLKLGIQAPREVRVFRAELLEERAREPHLETVA
ncbi:N/A [soil metagenome]